MVGISGDSRMHVFPAIDRTIPSDWEAVAFPLVAALLTDSEIVIENIDSSGSQGDEAIVEILRSVGANIQWNKDREQLIVRGGIKAGDGFGRLSAEHFPDRTLRINCAGFPDAVPALSVIACFIEGTTIIEDIGVCRKKETDRITVMCHELTKLGAFVEEGEDYMIIHGHSPLTPDGKVNPEFKIHGGTVDSFKDHRVAMSFAVMGLALQESVTVKDAECCAVSFPDFFPKMGALGAGFDCT